MERHARLAVMLCPLVLLTACGSGQRREARLLNDRLQAALAPDIAAGTVALQPLSDGAQVTLLSTSQLPESPRSLNQQRDARASVIEGLLDPRLMRIQLADTSQTPVNMADTRVVRMTRYMTEYGVDSTLQPADPAQAAVPGPAGSVPDSLTVTITVQCPPGDGVIGYGDGKSKPVCD